MPPRPVAVPETFCAQAHVPFTATVLWASCLDCILEGPSTDQPRAEAASSPSLFPAPELPREEGVPPRDHGFPCQSWDLYPHLTSPGKHWGLPSTNPWRSRASTSSTRMPKMKRFSSPASSAISTLAPSIVPMVRAPFTMNFMLPVPEASVPAVEICWERSAAGITARCKRGRS